MDLNYGCDVSNRYMGYLDSSDHGNSVSATKPTNKRKSKKKRKPRKKSADKCNKMPLVGENVESPVEQEQPAAVESAVDAKDDSFYQETDTNSTNYPKSVQSSESPSLSDTTYDEARDTNGDYEAIVSSIAAKWSTICFEEEKVLIEQETGTNDSQTESDENRNNSHEMYGEKRIYPTVYFYNSNFGYKNRRRVVFNDWHDPNKLRRPYNSNRNNDGQYGEEDKRKRRNNNERRRKKFTQKVEDNQGNVGEQQSAGTDSQNESNDRASQHTTDSNYRDFVNSNKRYSEFKHDRPSQTFSRRRRDFVRNV